jgi:hypothetical protein
MRFLVFLLLYGMLALSGGFLTVYWGVMATRRVRALGGLDIRLDRVFWIALALSISNLGLTVLAATRAFSNGMNGLPPNMMGLVGLAVGTGLMVMLLSQIMMVWLADLERSRPVWLWGMAAMSLVWSLVCVLLVQGT